MSALAQRGSCRTSGLLLTFKEKVDTQETTSPTRFITGIHSVWARRPKLALTNIHHITPHFVSRFGLDVFTVHASNSHFMLSRTFLTVKAAPMPHGFTVACWRASKRVDGPR